MIFVYRMVVMSLDRLIGGRQLSVGPEAALSLLIGQMVQEIINDPDHPVESPELEGAAVAIVTTFQVS